MQNVLWTIVMTLLLSGTAVAQECEVGQRHSIGKYESERPERVSTLIFEHQNFWKVKPEARIKILGAFKFAPEFYQKSYTRRFTLTMDSCTGDFWAYNSDVNPADSLWYRVGFIDENNLPAAKLAVANHQEEKHGFIRVMLEELFHASIGAGLGLFIPH